MAIMINNRNTQRNFKRHYKILYQTLCILLLFLIMFIMVQAKEYTIIGTIVDKTGKPIKEVTVIVESKKQYKGVDRLIFSEETDENGHFQIKKEANVGDIMYLELKPSPIAYTLNPIQPPFFKSFENLYNQLFQRKIIFGNSSKINVGKLQVNFPYPVVELSIVNSKGEPVFKFDEDTSSIWLCIYDKNGNQAADDNFDTIQKKGAFGVDSTVTLALPRGAWKLKIGGDLSCEKVFGSSKFFAVQSAKNNMVIEVNSLK